MHVVTVFVFGACFGSFFNVCIYRIPKGLGLSLPPSHCYQCGRHLKWHDNIPLLSYWVLRGRCRFCRTPYSMRYFGVELLTACAFAGAFACYSNPETGYSLVVIPGLIFISLLIVATFTDLDHWIIPDRISLGGLGAGLVLALIWPIGLAAHSPLAAPFAFIKLPEAAVPIMNAATGAAVGYGVLWLVAGAGSIIFRKEAMGQGDLKLLAMFGAFLGPLNTLITLVLASFVGSISGLSVMAWGKWISRAKVPASVAALTPDADRCHELVERHGLRSDEKLVVTRALTSPGAVGTPRHHLPFGPSLAVAAAAVFFAHEAIRDWASRVLLFPPL